MADAASAGGSADLVRARAPRRVRADSHGDGHDARARLPPGPGAGIPIPEASRLRQGSGGPPERESAKAEASGGWLADLAEVQQIAQQTLDRIRTRSRLLHPVILDDFGLQQAIAWYADEFTRQHGIDTEFEPEGDLTGLPREVATHLYRIVQESLTNVARHARASRAVVRLARDGRLVSLRIDDDGRGLDAGGPPAGERPGGIGITGMRERAALMNGTFTMGRSGLGGIAIEVAVPWQS